MESNPSVDKFGWPVRTHDPHNKVCLVWAQMYDSIILKWLLDSGPLLGRNW